MIKILYSFIMKKLMQTQDTQEFKKLSNSEVTEIFTKAVEQDTTEKKRKGLPVARYDLDSKRAYLENIDGTREYI